MSLDRLNRKFQELMQKKMNTEFRIDREEEVLHDLKTELAELKGQLKLIEELAQEAQEAASRGGATHPAAGGGATHPAAGRGPRAAGPETAVSSQPGSAATDAARSPQPGSAATDAARSPQPRSPQPAASNGVVIPDPELEEEDA